MCFVDICGYLVDWGDFPPPPHPQSKFPSRRKNMEKTFFKMISCDLCEKQ